MDPIVVIPKLITSHNEIVVAPIPGIKYVYIDPLTESYDTILDPKTLKLMKKLRQLSPMIQKHGKITIQIRLSDI